jgi:hypothetical protein
MSGIAAREPVKAGYSNVINLDGGMNARNAPRRISKKPAFHQDAGFPYLRSLAS